MFGEWGIGKRQRGRGERGEREEAEGQGERSRGERGNFVFSPLPLPPASSGCKGLIATTATKTLE